MTNFVIPAPKVASIPVAGSGQFPVRRIYCIGRNYAAHAVEMGHDPDREPPFFFQKNSSNLDPSGEFPYPPKTSDVHHEVELVVALKSGGTNIPVDRALDHVWGYGIGLDMTRRDLQAVAKDKRRPWDTGKDFENAAVIGPITRAAAFGTPGPQAITLRLNGEVRQASHLSDMVWSVPEIIAHLSTLYHLMPGDLIYTGTPAGVGAVQPGDRLVGEVAGLSPVELTYGAAE